MRSFAPLLLLLLAMPGLVLPAGLWLRICRCVAPMGTTTQTCCTNHAAAAVEPAAPSCCAGNTESSDDSPLRIVPKCGCEWHALGDDRPESTTPEPTPALAQPTVLPLVPFVLPAEPTAPDSLWVRTTSRAPPGAQRNLPLRS